MDEKFITVNGREWHLDLDFPKDTLWNCEMWWCSDGDQVELYLKKDQSGFDLCCFSGIPGSSFIHLDMVDFGVYAELWDQKKTSFEERCVHIADHLCSLIFKK